MEHCDNMFSCQQFETKMLKLVRIHTDCALVISLGKITPKLKEIKVFPKSFILFTLGLIGLCFQSIH